jgi:elongation factor G
MADFTTDQIRNIALVGHGDSGKTILAETVLFKAGEIARRGCISEGTTTSDFEEDERATEHSIDSAITKFTWQDRLFHLIDTPGYPDYIGSAIASLGAVETAVIAINATAGVMVNTRRVWQEADALGCGRIILITKMDQENIDVDGLLEQIKTAFGDACVPANLPIGTGATFTGVASVFPLAEDMPAALEDQAADLNQNLTELIIEADEALLERYLEEEAIGPDELGPAFSSAIREGSVVPILFASSEADKGVSEFLDFVALNAPSPAGTLRRTATPEGAEEAVAINSDQPLSAQVFRVLSDDYVGKVSFLRVFSGEMKSDSTVHNPQTGKNEKIAQIFCNQGKDQTPVDRLVAGMIGTVTKIEHLQYGDSLCDSSAHVQVTRPTYPNPMVSLAVEPKSRGDEGKIGGAMAKLAEIDPTFNTKRDPQTAELVVSGISTLHLETLLGRLKAQFKVDVNTKAPRIPYLETITASADVEYTHKKQTGGAGQFARVFLKVEPNERGAGYEFVDEIVGGAIDQPLRGSVDKGIRAKMGEGIYAGYPIVDVKVRLYDGKTHPVDSKDIAFQIAGRNALVKAFETAKPVLLEPVVILEVTVPSRFMGDITGDVNGRRGRIMGMDSIGDMQIIRAQVPLGEVSNYSTELKSLTGGEGSFTLEFSHYDAVPSHAAQQIVAKAKKAAED